MDVKDNLRDLKTDSKEAVRDADGHQVKDDVANAGDRIRDDLGKAGDKVREEVDRLHREGHEKYDEATSERR